MNLSPAEIAHEEAHIHENKAYQQIIAISVFGVFAFVSVVMRVVARKVGQVPLGMDDYLIIAAMVRSINPDDYTEIIDDGSRYLALLLS